MMWSVVEHEAIGMCFGEMLILRLIFEARPMVWVGSGEMFRCMLIISGSTIGGAFAVGDDRVVWVIRT